MTESSDCPPSRNLQFLTLNSDHVTDAGLEKLRKASPALTKPVATIRCIWRRAKAVGRPVRGLTVPAISPILDRRTASRSGQRLSGNNCVFNTVLKSSATSYELPLARRSMDWPTRGGHYRLARWF